MCSKLILVLQEVPSGFSLVGAGRRWLVLVGAGWRWSVLVVGAGMHLVLLPICAKCATCSWEILTLFNLQLVVAGEHGLFGGHESEDI